MKIRRGVRGWGGMVCRLCDGVVYAGGWGEMSVCVCVCWGVARRITAHPLAPRIALRLASKVTTFLP